MQKSLPQPLRSGLSRTWAAVAAWPLWERARALVGGWPWPRIVRRLALLTTIGMFLVLEMGTLVTNSGSARGCGGSWPLCNGQFIPQFAVSTLIEFSHRAVTGIESLLVFALTAGVLWLWRGRTEIKFLAPLMVVFLILQAALGALAVIYPESPEVLALHFGVSLISFASILLTALFIFELGRWDRLRDRAIPRGFRRLVFAVTGFTYVVVYLGAYVQHRGVQLACTDWPLCNGHVVPPFSGGQGVVFIHRLAALALTAGVVGMLVWARRLRKPRPDLYWASAAALVLVLAQVLEGATIVFSRLDLFSTLGHAAFVALLFGTLCYLCLHVLPRPEAVRRVEQARRKSVRSVRVRHTVRAGRA